MLICQLLTCICFFQIRAIADESVRATGRQQNDIARLDGSFIALSAAVSDADVRHSRDAAGASIGDVERVNRSVAVAGSLHSQYFIRSAEQSNPCVCVSIQTLAPFQLWSKQQLPQVTISKKSSLNYYKLFANWMSTTRKCQDLKEKCGGLRSTRAAPTSVQYLPGYPAQPCSEHWKNSALCTVLKVQKTANKSGRR